MELKSGICPSIYVMDGIIMAEFVCGGLRAVSFFPKGVKVLDNPASRVRLIMHGREKAGSSRDEPVRSGIISPHQFRHGVMQYDIMPVISL